MTKQLTTWYTVLVAADFAAVCLSVACPCLFFSIVIASFWLLVITPMGYLVQYAAKSSDRHDLLKLAICYFMFVAYNLIKPFLYEQHEDSCQKSTLAIESWAIGLANIGLPVSLLTEWYREGQRGRTSRGTPASSAGGKNECSGGGRAPAPAAAAGSAAGSHSVGVHSS